MGLRITFDDSLCASVGMCESVAPDFFEIGDDGAMHVKDASPAACHRDLIEDAVDACPTGALGLIED